MVYKHFVNFEALFLLRVVVVGGSLENNGDRIIYWCFRSGWISVPICTNVCKNMYCKVWSTVFYALKT